MQLHPYWQTILKRAWSVRLIVLAAALSGMEAILNVTPDLVPLPASLLALLVFFVTSAALIARIIVQTGVPR